MALAVSLLGSLALYLGHANAPDLGLPRRAMPGVALASFAAAAALFVRSLGAGAGSMLLLGTWMLALGVWPLLGALLQSVAFRWAGRTHD